MPTKTKVKIPKLAKFGGKVKTSTHPPNKKANEEYGMAPTKRVSDATLDYDASQGNRERGFIQNTPKKATGAMMGREPPMGLLSSAPPSMGARRPVFKKPKGKKVF